MSPPTETAPAASSSVASEATQSSTTAAPRVPTSERNCSGDRSRAADRELGPGGERQLERLGADVDGNDPNRAQRPQQLDRQVADTADPDDNGGRAGPQVMGRRA